MAVIAGRDQRAWGRAWHTPSGPARTQREAVGDLARMAGAGPVPVRAIPAAVIKTAGLFSPLMRELAETRYQFTEDFVLDSSAAQRVFGLEPTPWDSVLAAVLRSYGWQGADQDSSQSVI
jgi:nucleoside-diphosphate-sugar epimerase